jgi:hypothetical protein
MGVNNIDLALAQKPRETADLSDGIAIIKRVQAELGDFTKAHPIGFIAQYAAGIQTRQVHAIAPALPKQACKLKSLAF